MTAQYTIGGTTTTVSLVPVTLIGGESGWGTEDPPYGSQGSFFIQCDLDIVPGGGPCCDENGSPIVSLTSFGVAFDPPEGATPMTGFQGFTECHGGTPFSTTQTLGAPVTDAIDFQVLMGPNGPFRCGCDTEMVGTFAAAHPTEHGSTISVTVSGTVCVPNPCDPPADDTRYWCVLTRTHPYKELIAGGSKYATYDRAPRDWLTGPHFRGYIVDTTDPETGECTGHFTTVDCDIEDHMPFWCVEYQDYIDGQPFRKPYSGCLQSNTSGIVCRNWCQRPSCDEHEPPQPVEVECDEPTVESVDFDPARARLFGLDLDDEEIEFSRTATYVDGPWPDQRYCCLACPECGRARKAPPHHSWEFNAFVSSDWNKKPGQGPYENEQLLRCMMGWDFDEFDCCRLNFLGEAPEDCGEDPGTPFDGYSQGKKLQFHNLLGGQQQNILSDCTDALFDPGLDVPPSLGLVNTSLGPWGQREGGGAGIPGFEGGAPDWGDKRWWVVPSPGEQLEDDAGVYRLSVEELNHPAFPAVWYAGPFMSEAAALTAAADPDGKWWCCLIQDVDGDDQPVGLPYKGCVKQQDMPFPPDPVAPCPGCTTPPRWRVGITLAGADLDPDHDYPEGVETRTLTLLDGTWTGAASEAPLRMERCAANCAPCGPLPPPPGPPPPPPMMMMMAAVPFAARSQPTAVMKPTPTPDRLAALALAIRRARRCIDLGPKVQGEPCGSPLHTCNRYGDVTAKFGTCSGAARSCRDCPDYRPVGAGRSPPG